jgi:hypothetical protein
VLVYGLDGFRPGNDAEGGQLSGSRARFGACSNSAPAGVPPPSGDIQPSRLRYQQLAESYPVRMFVTEPLAPVARQCLLRTEDPDACLTTHGVEPLPRTDARFGLGVYEHRSGPSVLEPFGDWGFEAFAMADGVEYLVSRAVVSAPAAPRLVVVLPGSGGTRIVALFTSETAALDDCERQLGHVAPPTSPAQERAQLEEFDRQCLTSVELRLDGRLPPRQDRRFQFGEQQVVLPPGGDHTVTVEVTRNDPRNVRVALVVWEERS